MKFGQSNCVILVLSDKDFIGYTLTYHRITINLLINHQKLKLLITAKYCYSLTKFNKMELRLKWRDNT